MGSNLAVALLMSPSIPTVLDSWSQLQNRPYIVGLKTSSDELDFQNKPGHDRGRLLVNKELSRC